MMKSVSDPFVAVIGTRSQVDSSFLVCEGKVLIKNIGSRVFSMLLILIAFCHTFNVEFNPEVREAMEFIQERLLGIAEGKKKSTAFVNILRAVSCIQCRTQSEASGQTNDMLDLDDYHEDDDDFGDETQITCEWES